MRERGFIIMGGGIKHGNENPLGFLVGGEFINAEGFLIEIPKMPGKKGTNNYRKKNGSLERIMVQEGEEDSSSECEIPSVPLLPYVFVGRKTAGGEGG